MRRERYDKLRKANRKLMSQMGQIIVTDRSNVESMLNICGVNFNGGSTSELVEAYADALPENNRLQVCTAYMIADKKASNFDGMIDNDNVYLNHDIIYNYWDWDLGSEDYQVTEDDTASFTGGGAVKAIASVTEKAIDAVKDKKNAATNAALKKQETKQALLQAVIAQKQQEADAVAKQAEAKSKTNKSLIIAASIIGGLAVLGLAIYAYKKSR